MKGLQFADKVEKLGVPKNAEIIIQVHNPDDGAETASATITDVTYHQGRNQLCIHIKSPI